MCLLFIIKDDYFLIILKLLFQNRYKEMYLLIIKKIFHMTHVYFVVFTVCFSPLAFVNEKRKKKNEKRKTKHVIFFSEFTSPFWK